MTTGVQGGAITLCERPCQRRRHLVSSPREPGQLQRIREFIVALEQAVDDTTRARVCDARLAWAHHRLPPDIKVMITSGYLMCLKARARGGAHRAEAARHEVMAHLIGGTGMTREQFLSIPEPRLIAWRPCDPADDPADAEPLVPVPQLATRRADSEPHARSVATAVAMPGGDEWPPSIGWPRRRQIAALGALAACACLVFLATAWFAIPLPP